MASLRLLCAIGLMSCNICGCACLSARSEPDRPLAPPEAGGFSLVILPDTQKYVASEWASARLNAQTRWIADNREKLNIAFVLHAGDIVNSSDRDREWRRAHEAFSILDDKVPYVLSVGNHDLDGPSTFFRTRGTTAYNKHFPPSRFEHQPWYGGRQQLHENDNYFVLFEHQDLKFMVISLEFAPPDDVLRWANQVVAAHPDRRVVVLTHCYLHYFDGRVTRFGLTNPHNFHLPEVNDGRQMWKKFVSRHPNIFLVVSGHCLGVGRLTSVGIHGNEVHQVLADFQGRLTYAGGAWLRIMQFSPQHNTISVKTYSPHWNQWLTNSANEFTLTYGMQASSGESRIAEVATPDRQRLQNPPVPAVRQD